jgi:hypothetical protein
MCYFPQISNLCYMYRPSFFSLVTPTTSIEKSSQVSSCCYFVCLIANYSPMYCGKYSFPLLIHNAVQKVLTALTNALTFVDKQIVSAELHPKY